MTDITQLSQIYESINDLKMVSCMGTRDGGSHHIEFSDGFKCMFDWGIHSSTKGNFVKSWKDRTIINLPEKYKKILRDDERFGFKDKI